MFEIGASLREARARRQLSYDQVEAETKIRAKYIRCMEDEQFDVLPSGTYVRGFLRTYADYLGLDGQLYVDEYSSRYGALPDERAFRRRERPQQRRNESSNAVMLALAGIVAVGVLLLAAWKLNPSSGQTPRPIPPVETSTRTNGTPGANPSSYSTVKQQQKDKDKQANKVDLTPPVQPVTLRIDIANGQSSYLTVRRLSNLQKIVYQRVLTSPEHIGGTMQKDAKGYLITAACNPTALTLMVNGQMFTLDPASTGPYKITAKGLVKTRAPAGVPSGGCSN